MNHMANHKRNRLILPGCLVLILLSGCYKYKDAPQLSSPAYLRVFNSIPSQVNALTASRQHFLCFLFDPAFDAAGAPAGGAVVGDWLQTRELFSLSYPIDAGTALNAGNGNSDPFGTSNYVTNTNYEYPGKMHVLTAPSMNGLDLSSWAQVPSGKHRILFVVRPQSNTSFGELGSSLRKTILIDTTVNLTAGEVYTLDAVITNPDSNYFGAYIRQEQFIHQSFDTGRLYAAFYNLSGKPSFLSGNFNYPDFWNYPDTLAINYTYRVFDDLFSPVPRSGAGDVPAPARPLAGNNNVYFGTTIRGRDDLSVYTPLPFLPGSYFFDQKSVLRTYWENNSSTGTGTLPFVSFNFLSANPQQAQSGFSSYPTLLCTADPATFNTFDPDVVNNSLADIALGTQYPGKYIYQPNLNLVVQSGGAVNIFPTINLFEIIYNRIYLMQLQREFVKVPE
jgi:hypothetical protein